VNEIEAGSFCQSCYECIRKGSIGLKHVPGYIERIIEEGIWRRRKIATGEIVEFGPHDFRLFIEGPPLEGWGESAEKIAALLKDDPNVLRMFRDALLGKEGGDTISDKAKTTGNNVTSGKPQRVTGNTKSYSLSRLHRERPDLYEQVCAKQISANSAMIEAGFRAKTMTVPITADGVLKAYGKLSKRDQEIFKANIGNANHY